MPLTSETPDERDGHNLIRVELGCHGRWVVTTVFRQSVDPWSRLRARRSGVACAGLMSAAVLDLSTMRKRLKAADTMFLKSSRSGNGNRLKSKTRPWTRQDIARLVGEKTWHVQLLCRPSCLGSTLGDSGTWLGKKWEHA